MLKAFFIPWFSQKLKNPVFDQKILHHIHTSTLIK
mgnify:CR=1 FL=1